MPDRPTLLFVCHANICRSPMAERVARHEWSAIRAFSAGTHARAGAAMHPGARMALSEVGVDGGDFRSRELSTAILAAADLVLTASREQRGTCVTLCPSTVKRTFTILQFGRLAAAIDPERVTGGDPALRLARLLEEVTRVRGSSQPVSALDDDLADPVNGTAEDMRACLGQIQGCMRPALGLIAET